MRTTRDPTSRTEIETSLSSPFDRRYCRKLKGLGKNCVRQVQCQPHQLRNMSIRCAQRGLGRGHCGRLGVELEARTDVEPVCSLRIQRFVLRKGCGDLSFISCSSWANSHQPVYSGGRNAELKRHWRTRTILISCSRSPARWSLLTHRDGAIHCHGRVGPVALPSPFLLSSCSSPSCSSAASWTRRPTPLSHWGCFLGDRANCS